MDVMLHIPAQAWEVLLLDLAGNSLAGPIPIDATPFAAGGLLHQATVRQFLTTTRHDDQQFVKLGRAMQAALIPPLIDHALRQHNPARIYLAIENADLQELPWELLQSNTSQFAKFLNVDKVCLRATGKLLQPAPVAPAYPLRMLIVCGFDPSEPDAAEGYAEIAAIQQALNGSGHLLNCEVLHVAKQFRLANGSRQVIDLSRRPLDRPTPGQSADYDFPALTAHIASARPHILHFIGHSQDGALRLFMRGMTGADDGYIPWDTARIRAFAASLPDLRLVYLNSCRSGQTSEQAAALFPDSLAHTFLNQASAVVAMQSDVSGDSAKVCAEIFYQRLLQGDDAATALHHARAQLFQKHGSLNRETYLPVLVSRSPIEQVLRLTVAADPAVAQAWHLLLDKPPDKIRQHFVNQHQPRRSLYDAILAASNKVVAVNGKAEAGKSWLLKQAIHALALQGWCGRYVVAPPSCDWLQLTREIVKTDGLLRPDLHQKDHFIDALNRLSKAPGYTPGTPQDVAGTLAEIQARRPSNTFSAEVLPLLRQVLAAQANRHPHVLIIDQWENVESSNREILRQDFLHGPGDDLIVVLGWSRQDSDTPDIRWTDIPMREFSLAEVREIGPDLISCIYPGRDLTKAFRWVMDFENPQKWTAKQLNEACTLAKLMIP